MKKPSEILQEIEKRFFENLELIVRPPHAEIVKKCYQFTVKDILTEAMDELTEKTTQ